MLRKVIEVSLAQRTMVLAVLVFFLGAGAMAFHRLNIEAYLDPSPPMMEIITQNPGQSAEEIERYITIPDVGLSAWSARTARHELAADASGRGNRPARDHVPATCPWSLAQLQDEDFWPEASR